MSESGVTTEQAKSYLRKILLHRRRLLSVRYRNSASERIAQKISGLPEFRAARWVLGYWTADSEVDTWPVLRKALAAGKRIALPRCATPLGAVKRMELVSWKPGNPLVIGRWGIPEPAEGEPVAVGKLDFALVPGLGFDIEGGRLGRGKGFYDRFLKRFKGTSCGLAFETQHVGWIPVTRGDARIQLLATEKSIYRYGGSHGNADTFSNRSGRGGRGRIRA